MKNIVTYLNLTLILVLFVLFFNKKEKLVYVDSTRLFENFAMTKESFKEFDKIIEIKKYYLDSLESNLKNLEIDLKSKNKISQEEEKKYYLLQQDYANKKNQFEEEGKVVINENRNKISARINEYTSIFGKEKGYKYIFGVNGNGNVMFAEEGTDITTELTDFINEKYSGNHN